MMFKSTHEILASNNGRTSPDLWEKITGIPEFDPDKHSDGCSGGMSAGYAELRQEIRDRIGETLRWRKCCVVHDRAYYYGGSRAEKQAANEALKQCVVRMFGDEILGVVLGIGDAVCRYYRRIALFCNILPMGLRRGLSWHRSAPGAC